MSIFSIENYKVNGEGLDIYVDSSKLEGYEDIQVVFRNRKSKERLYFTPNIERRKEETVLNFNVNELKCISKKNIIDLALKIDNKEYRLYKEVSNIDKNLNRYSERYIDIGNNDVAVPYLTLKSELSIIYGFSAEVFREYCIIDKDKISVENIKFNEGILSFTIESLDLNTYSHFNLTAQSRDDKKVESLDYNYNGNMLTINLNEFKNINSSDEYGLCVEIKVGNVLKVLSVGTDNINLNNYIFSNKKNIDELGKVLPFTNKKGQLSIATINDKHSIDLKRYEVVNSTLSIDDTKLVENTLKILIRDVNNKLDLYKKSILLKDVKNNDVFTLSNDQYSIKDNTELEVYLDKIFIRDIFKNNQRWKIVVKLYDEENNVIEMNDLTKESNWIASKKERYNKPIVVNKDISVISYTSETNKVTFLIGGMDIYIKEVYKRFEGVSEIDNIKVGSKSIAFDIVNFNKNVVDGLSLIIIERKSKRSWTKNVNLDNIISSRVKIDLSEFINENQGFKSRWDVYIEIFKDSVILKNRIGQFNKKLAPKHQRYYGPIRSKDGGSIAPYLTIKNELSIVIGSEASILNEKITSKIALVNFDMNNSIISGEVDLELPDCDDYTVDSVIIEFRSSVADISYKINSKSERIKENRYLVKFNLDLCKYEFEQFYWDFFIIVRVENQEYKVKINNPKKEIKENIAKKIIKFSYTNKNGYIIYPYISRVGSLAISYRKKAYYESDLYKFKENLAYYTYRIFKRYFDRKDIWLGYEKFSEGAQDNGFYFFEYCYKNNKRKNFYYIIKKSSNDYENVSHMKDKVLEFMSFKYMVYMYAAKLLVSSESKGHSYDVRIEKGKLKKALDKKKIVFLQHGVIALKKIDYIFKKTKGNVVDLFVVSSEYEKNIIKNHFDYNEDEIINTGLCRWDVLEDKSDSNNREILLMPTWRSWMDGISEEKFMETEYYKSYFELLNSYKLQEVIKKNNVKLKFFIHPKFKEYISKFSSNNENISIYEYGEVKVNDLLMKSSMLITDYSSVAWDMYYQKKPIVFYQFDIEDYDKYQGSYLDMDSELFGDRVFKVEELIQTIEEYICVDFEEKNEYADMRSKYFTHVDKKNCERTYKTILSKKKMLYKSDKQLFIISKLRKNRVVRNVWKKMKKNRYSKKIALTIKRLIR